IGLVILAVGVPRKGVGTAQLGFEVYRRRYPVHVLQQILEALQPLLPLVLDASVRAAKWHYLSVQIVHHEWLRGQREHFATDQRPVFDTRQRRQCAPVDLAALAGLRHIRREHNILDASVNDRLLRHGWFFRAWGLGELSRRTLTKAFDRANSADRRCGNITQRAGEYQASASPRQR